MKTAIITFALLTFGLFAKAQFVVTDPNSYAFYIEQIANQVKEHGQTAQQIAEAKKTYTEVKEGVEEAKKQTSFLSDARDLLKNINAKLKTLQYIERAIAYQEGALKRTQECINYVKNSGQFSEDEINMVIFNMTQLTAATNRSVGLLKSIFEDGLFNMNDSERLERLTKLEAETRELRYDVDRFYESYTILGSKRAMFSSFGGSN